MCLCIDFRNFLIVVFRAVEAVDGRGKCRQGF